jgi:hypothetical protein
MPPPTTATFWSLIDRWHLTDEEALEIVAFDGKLPATATRPRFKLSEAQAGVVSVLLEIDSALAIAGIGQDWLREAAADQRTPVDLLRAGEAEEVLKVLRQRSFALSVEGGPRKPPRREGGKR